MIGVFGGTFDPVHFGHLRPALEMHVALGLDELRWIPCRQPPHRDMPVANAEQRVAMLRDAIDGVPGFVVDTREIRRGGPSWMVDTLASLRDEMGRQTPLILLLGSDALAGLHRWREPQRILELAHLGIMQRPGGKVPDTAPLRKLLAGRETTEAANLARQPAGLLYRHAVTQLDISATCIRALLRAGHSPRFLLPGTVLARIHREDLYAAGGGPKESTGQST